MKRNLPKMIVFFGADGAGKSTQANLLMDYYMSKGYSTTQTWIRGRHLFAYVLSEILMNLGYYRVEKVPSGMVYKVFDPKLVPGFSKVWGSIEVISIIPRVFIGVWLPKMLGKVVITDRYVIDSLVYLSYWLGSGFLRSIFARFLHHLLPEDCILFHLDADFGTLINRLLYDTSSKEFLVYQIRYYRLLGRLYGANTIDTSKLTKENVFQRIVEKIESKKG